MTCISTCDRQCAARYSLGRPEETARTHSLLDPPHVAVKLVLARFLLLLARLGEGTPLREQEQDSAHRLRDEGEELGVEGKEVLERERRSGETERLRPLFCQLTPFPQLSLLRVGGKTTRQRRWRV